MKTVIYFLLFAICISCKGQNIQHKVNQNSAAEIKLIDTVSILSLQNKQYGSFSYKVLQLELSDTDELGYRIKKIVILKNSKKIASILLPNSENVNNFSVTKIEETKSGFKIVVNWGGGNYFYSRQFYFTLKNNQFYLDSLEMNSYTQEPEKETKRVKKIDPPVILDNFIIDEFLNNE